MQIHISPQNAARARSVRSHRNRKLVWVLALTGTHWKLLYGGVRLVPWDATAAVTLNWP